MAARSHGSHATLRSLPLSSLLFRLVMRGYNAEAVVLALAENAGSAAVRDDVNSRTPLHYSVTLEGNFAACDALVDNIRRCQPHLLSKYINWLDVKGESALHRACRCNRDDMVTYLLDLGADPMIQSSVCGDTPLHVAAEFMAWRALRVLLLVPNVKVNVRNSQGLSPLFHASLQSNVDGCKMLIESGADVNATGHDGLTALHAAASLAWTVGSPTPSIAHRTSHVSKTESSKVYDCHPVLRYLVTVGAKINAKLLDSKATPLFGAVEMNHLGNVARLVMCGADVNAILKNKMTPLFLAVFNQSMTIVEYLLSHGASVNAVCSDRASSVMHIAAAGDNLGLVTLLAKAGADIGYRNSRGQLPVHVAAKTALATAALPLLSNGNKLNDELDGRGCSPLAIAVKFGCVDNAFYFIENEASVDIGIGAMQLCLLLIHGYQRYASSANLQSKWRQLLFITLNKTKTSISDISKFRDKKGRPIIFLAVKLGDPTIFWEIYKILGTTLNATTASKRNGATLLHAAVKSGYCDILDVILQLDVAAIDTVDDRGETPLHVACRKENAVAIIRLLEAGAEVAIQDEQGRLPKHLLSSKTSKCALTLAQYGDG